MALNSSITVLKAFTEAIEISENPWHATAIFNTIPEESADDGSGVYHQRGNPDEEIMGKEPNWTRVSNSDDADAWWVRLLCCSKGMTKRILEEAWDGRGNLWVCVRPDLVEVTDPPHSRCFPEQHCSIRNGCASSYLK